MEKKTVDKFAIDSLKNIQDVLHNIQYEAFDPDHRDNDRLLLDTVDHLCRVANMLAGVIREEKSKGFIENNNPQKYAENKLLIAQRSFNDYLKSTRG
ncbi:hypothetical protein BEH_07725 [Priestia filamentosa]|uniref:Uncharacterized protein n=1 Tax=Priestia filamentosa TaxID=1402861 RepID=A0A0H4KUM4_9BACI|nr:hypothetical protein [Priestia filamentosa]AKO91998.1 hypothetical protein BEH_07725 [Priestia filamentosa]